jgi:hypothetical protein
MFCRLKLTSKSPHEPADLDLDSLVVLEELGSPDLHIETEPRGPVRTTPR